MRTKSRWVSPEMLAIFRKVNLLRIALGIIFNILALAFCAKMYLFLSILYVVFSIFWFVQTEIDLINENKYPVFSYIPVVFDSVFVSLAVVLTGHSHSYLMIGFPLIVMLCSLNPLRNIGIVSAVLSSLLFLTGGILLKFNLWPYAPAHNAFENYNAWMLVYSTSALALVLCVINFVVHPMAVKLWKNGMPVVKK